MAVIASMPLVLLTAIRQAFRSSLPSSPSAVPSWARAVGRSRVTIDTRSLALFRILAGILIVGDILARSRNLTFFYTDEGVVPYDLAVAAEPLAAYSVYAFIRSPEATAVTFVVTGLVGVALAVGYYTRIVTILAFVLVVSLDMRNPFVLSFADTLFMTLLFIAILLPLGERWSIDAVTADRPRRTAVASVGTTIVLVQMILLYVVNGYHKTASNLWWSGEAAALVLGIDEMTWLFGDLLRFSPTLLQIGGFVWFSMLLGSWLLLVLRDRPRHLLLAAFMIAHISMALTVRIGAFSYVCVAGLTFFIQSSAWRDLAGIRNRVGTALNAQFGAGSAIGRTHRTIRNQLEASRGWLSRWVARVPRPTPPLERWFPFELTERNALAVITIVGIGVLIVVGSLSVVGVVNDDTPETEVEAGVTSLYEFQSDWSIFAPHPRRSDRYYVFPAITTEGETVDVRNDRPLTYDRPYKQLQQQHDTYRERFYMGSMRSVGGQVGENYAEHLCETYETDSGARLTHINMYAIDERITWETIDDPTNRERSETLLIRHGCGDERTRLISPP